MVFYFVIGLCAVSFTISIIMTQIFVCKLLTKIYEEDEDEVKEIDKDVLNSMYT